MTARPRCAALGCDILIAPWKTFCAHHWAACPDQYRSKITRWIKWRRDKGLDWPDHWRGFGNNYRTAVGAAIHAIAAREVELVPLLGSWDDPRAEIRKALYRHSKADPFALRAVWGPDERTENHGAHGPA